MPPGETRPVDAGREVIDERLQLVPFCKERLEAYIAVVRSDDLRAVDQNPADGLQCGGRLCYITVPGQVVVVLGQGIV